MKKLSLDISLLLRSSRTLQHAFSIEVHNRKPYIWLFTLNDRRSPRTTPRRWLWAHHKMQHSSGLDLFPRENRNTQLLPVQGRGLNIDVLRGVAIRLHTKRLSIC